VGWYYKLMGEEIGLLSAAELRQHALDGKLTLDTYVRRADSDRWISAEKIKGLFDKQASQASPPVSPPQQPTIPSGRRHEEPRPQPATKPAQPGVGNRGPAVPLGWVVAGAAALVAVFGAVFLMHHESSPSGSSSSFTPSGGGGGNRSAKIESLRFQITQLQEDQRRIERKIEDVDAEQRRESDKRRNSPTRGIEGIEEALKYKRESESRVRMKELHYHDLSKLRKQIEEKKKELEVLER
jgi:hypothetical protein